MFLENGKVEAEIVEKLSSNLLTVDEVCKILGITRMTLARMEERDAGPPRIRVGGRNRYSLPELNRWLAENTVM